MNFPVEEEALNRAREVAARGKALHAEWDSQFAEWEKENPERGSLFARLSSRSLPDGWEAALPVFPADPKGTGTRRTSGKILTALAPVLPELWGGSADLAESNNTTMEGEPSFLPLNRQSEMWPGNPYGRTLHFGIREHGMGTILNGITVSGAHPALRRDVPAVQRLHARCRAAGGADGDPRRRSSGRTTRSASARTARRTSRSSTCGRCGTSRTWTSSAPPTRMKRYSRGRRSWKRRTARPGSSCPGRTCRRSTVPSSLPPELTARGAYVMADGTDVILIGTGSEVQIAVAARELLAAMSISARVVSMPCVEWFKEQDASYQEEVLPAAMRARVSVEAGITPPWKDVRRRRRRVGRR